jgi:hypothetical protein
MASQTLKTNCAEFTVTALKFTLTRAALGTESRDRD